MLRLSASPAGENRNVRMQSAQLAWTWCGKIIDLGFDTSGQGPTVLLLSTLRPVLAIMRCSRTMLFAAALCTQPCSAVAKDLNAIAEIVRPAYTAMNFALLCSQDDPWFLADTGGPLGNAIKYAEQIKNEAIASLTDEEAVIVLRKAADRARSAAREALRKVIPDYPTYQPGKIDRWCRDEAMRFVRAVVDEHDKNHAMLMQELDRAKR
jgi:hypothetical protein